MLFKVKISNIYHGKSVSLHVVQCIHPCAPLFTNVSYWTKLRLNCIIHCQIFIHHSIIVDTFGRASSIESF